MSLLRFLFGMLAVLVVFAAETYFVTQSLWTALSQTLICAVLIQLGYFVAILFLVWRSKDEKMDGTGTQANSGVPRIPARNNPQERFGH
jgi:exopolysaccharide production repressor protein